MVAAPSLATGRVLIGVYVHIPYCRTLCPYCDFVKRRIDGEVPKAFIDALCAEIEAFRGPDEACTVFFGGGTPSLIHPEALERILATLKARFVMTAPEVTLEANPDDVSSALVDAWADLGINRVSLGVQSFDDAALRYLGRRHDAARAIAACECVADRFDNWSMDLIFGARPAASFADTLRQCVRLSPKHVSAYGLTYEPGTPFGRRSHEAIDEETYLEAFWTASKVLRPFERYEVSNFALPGYRCVHNLLYWRNLDYAGFGPGAFSYIDGVRACNHAQLDAYLARPGEKEESLRLTEYEIRVETLIQHFRLKDGLLKSNYASRFGRSLEEDFGSALSSLLKAGLLQDTGPSICPTRKGFELNNEIGLALLG